MAIITYLISIFWFLLPAGFSNMAPVFFKKFNFLNIPVDFNKTFRNKPIFGKNKTFRGFFFGIILSIIIIYIQKLLYPFMLNYSIIDYTSINIYLLGFLLGFGALFGDLIKSFFKRQLNIAPGKPWIPFDQIDWVIGSLLFSLLYINISLDIILISILLFGIIHPLVNYIGYLLKIKKNKF
ncbi:CDP-archaeol synthase [Candidatus Woesearchaeota archaeon]|nr:CDP-archaeol synthase [Candidatus Woesearchaeota archaeon]